MPRSSLQELLARLGPDGTLACTCGKRHRISVKQVLVSKEALRESAGLLQRLHGHSPRVWVLSDEHTEAAAADRWKTAVNAGRLDARILPGEPKPVPTLALVNELSNEVRALAPELLVGVGSGVISDLVKKVSLDTGIPNWSIATAPSVDAYSSRTAAIRIEGYHQAVPAQPSEVIVCDLEVIQRAPRPLYLAGLGDLLAKYLANLDWNLAREVTNEPFCETIAELSLGAAREALSAARDGQGGALTAIRSLTEAALVSGFAMQALGSSRPAASAEHTIAHFWEMAHAVASPEQDLHGLLVGAACKLVLPGYTAWYHSLAGLELNQEDRLAALERERPWNERLETEMTPFKHKISEEMRGRTLDRAAFAQRLEAFSQSRGRILALASPLLEELSSAIDVLAGIGFPFQLDALGIDRPYRLLPVRNVRLLRNRYTTFDLAHELGREDVLMGAITRASEP
ncbi:iron-containing alcohol dehydrogenase [Stigmatella sp. ncwal1]|uniref:Iron-containing alcohol dehydrogenase n=1 Tax=Stigmatella ashevillensis TaxID=2995309 RepID=A0ABT5DJB7_9BACT|nr:iron-containing alcohol dehydrogenase [Stigmatella ashevillena]MDC0713723.1 iron-containing alcohol dehydrogenase [Stigmatella ashevillena]